MNLQEKFPLGVTAVMLPELDFDEQIALCAELGVTHYSLRPRVIPDAAKDQAYSNWGRHKFDLTPQRLAKEGEAIYRQLTDAGLTPFGTVPGASTQSSDDELKLHFEGAAKVKAGRVRVGPDKYPQDQPFDYPALLTKVIERYGRIIDMAKPMGLKLVIETHTGSLATSPALAWSICRAFDAQDIGVIFDLPNFAREGQVHPALAVSVLGPYIDHLHIGGCRHLEGLRDEFGFRASERAMCALTDSELHVPTWLNMLDKAGRHVPLIIEDFEADMPGAVRLRRSVEQVNQALEAALS